MEQPRRGSQAPALNFTRSPPIGFGTSSKSTSTTKLHFPGLTKLSTTGIAPNVPATSTSGTVPHLRSALDMLNDTPTSSVPQLSNTSKGIMSPALGGTPTSSINPNLHSPGFTTLSATGITPNVPGTPTSATSSVPQLSNTSKGIISPIFGNGTPTNTPASASPNNLFGAQLPLFTMGMPDCSQDVGSNSSPGKGHLQDNNCVICQNHYSDPRLLACHHCFCKACLAQLTIKETIKCPLCQTETLLAGNGVDGLLPLTPSMKGPSAGSNTQGCGQCDSTKITSYCTECECFLCELCDAAHKRMNAFKFHTLAPPKKPTKKQQKCSRHFYKSLEIYCKTCESMICHDCTLHSHKDHKFQSVEDTATEIKDKLVSERELLLTHLEMFRSHSQAIAEAEEHVRTYPEKVKAFLRSQFDEEHKKLDEHKERLLKEVDTRYKNVSISLSAEKEIVEKAIGELEAEIKSANKLLESNDKSEDAILSSIEPLEAIKSAKTLSWNPNVTNVGPFMVKAQSQTSFNSDVVHLQMLQDVRIDLTLTQIGYRDAINESKSLLSALSSKGFEKDSVYCVEAKLCTEGRIIFPEFNIWCVVTGPSSLAVPHEITENRYSVFFHEPEKVNGFISPHTKRWKISFKTAVCSNYFVKVQLNINGKFYCEKSTFLYFAI